MLSTRKLLEHSTPRSRHAGTVKVASQMMVLGGANTIKLHQTPISLCTPVGMGAPRLSWQRSSFTKDVWHANAEGVSTVVSKRCVDGGRCFKFQGRAKQYFRHILKSRLPHLNITKATHPKIGIKHDSPLFTMIHHYEPLKWPIGSPLLASLWTSFEVSPSRMQGRVARSLLCRRLVSVSHWSQLVEHFARLEHPNKILAHWIGYVLRYV